ncbi:MAG: SDR family oxidoreductase [Paracoccaceae bacterium]|jgi:7-alpha-hydroxysteroid dehydrogenase
MSRSIAGKTAIVTGAANGVGLSIARHFLDRGANVMFADIDEDKLVSEIGAADHGEGAARIFVGDLRQKLTITNLLSATMDAFDRVDILVNACRSVIPSVALSPDEDGVEELFQHNFITTLRLSQMVAKRMIQQAGSADHSSNQDTSIGTIVNLSSIVAQRAQPGLMGFSISMAALDQMTRVMAAELAPMKIRVNGVAIGSVMSASLQNILRDKPDYRTALIEGTPLGRLAAAGEVVETFEYLASDASGFMTGQILNVDGGRGLLDVVQSPLH